MTNLTDPRVEAAAMKCMGFMQLRDGNPYQNPLDNTHPVCNMAGCFYGDI